MKKSSGLILWLLWITVKIIFELPSGAGTGIELFDTVFTVVGFISVVSLIHEFIEIHISAD
jgi:hypothetical protein